MKSFWKKNRTIIIVVLVLLTAAAILIGMRARNRAAQDSAYQSEVIARGDLTAIVGATGTVRAEQSAVLIWQTNGQVGEVLAGIGDQVESGQVLARLAPTSLPQNLILAQADLVNAQRTLDTLKNSGTARSAAWLNLVNAQRAFEQAAALYNPASFPPASQDDIDQARTDLEDAQADLAAAQADYDAAETADQPGLFADLLAAQERVDQRQATLDWYLAGGPVNTTAALAEVRYLQALAALQDARRDWERVKDGPNPDDILAAQARVDAVTATLNLARIAAPFGGTVTDASPLAGDLVNAGTIAFRIDDLSRLLIDLQVTEIDINSIAVGQPAEVSFGAVLDQEYAGRVVSVSQTGTPVQGVVYYSVTVELTDADARVKPGMTAAVNIAVNQLTDVLLVPNRAVRVIEGGQRVVYILVDDNLVQVPIKLGASADAYSVVLEGDLTAGDTIVLNPPLTFSMDGPPPFAR